MAPLMIALLLVLNPFIGDGKNGTGETTTPSGKSVDGSQDGTSRRQKRHTDKQTLPLYSNNNPATFANVNYPMSSMDL